MVQKQPSYRSDGNSSEPTNKIPKKKMAQKSEDNAQYHHLNWRLGQWLYEGSYNIELDKDKGKYLLQKTLGKGGFGITYLAKDKTGKQVVIKTLNEEVQRRQDFEKFKGNFYNEALLAKYNHPHIATVIKIIHEEGLPCIVMEYIDGENIAQRVQTQGPLVEKEAIRYIRQIAEALIEVHRHKCLHRDVKPQNILMRKDGTDAVLIDFGIARPFGSYDDGTLTPFCTPCYAPPEQCEPQGKHGYYSDVYSLAATLYFMVTGNKPPNGESKSRKDTLFPRQQLNFNISHEVNNAILQGIKLKPEKRPQTVQEWLNLLSIETVSRPKKQRKPISWKVPLIGVPVLLLAFGAFELIQNYISPCQKSGILTLCHNMAEIPDVPALQKVTFGGSTTFAQLNPKVIAKIKQVHPQFRREHRYPKRSDQIPGSSIGVNWLIENKYDLSFSQSSQPLTDKQYKRAEVKSFKLQQLEVAYDVMAIYVKRDSPLQKLKGLTLNQVGDIFTGTVKNWNEVGDPDLPITIIKRKTQTTETRDVFQEQVLNNKPYGGNKKEFDIRTATIRAVIDTPGAIGYATASQVVNQGRIRILPIAKNDKSRFVSPCAGDTCKAVNKNLIKEQPYPEELIKNLYVIIKRDGGLKQQAGIAYANLLLSDEGQKLVEKAGFFPVRLVTEP